VEEITHVKSNIFWDGEKKKPGKAFLIVILMITVTLMSWIFVDYVTSIHEIKVVIELEENYDGIIRWGDESETIGGGSGKREFSFTVLEGITMKINVRRSSWRRTPITITIYDNGILAVQEIITDQETWIHFEYIVGK
jgi:hypothetical protein